MGSINKNVAQALTKLFFCDALEQILQTVILNTIIEQRIVDDKGLDKKIGDYRDFQRKEIWSINCIKVRGTPL